ncbi:MAG: hypothetical protein EOP27_00305 [Rhodococcus sp. (in: high G+C Gram-positive bacteria)]|nr:MAG: hypothetical protein EOP27_00305 [Rhodococcus sp. (in: high G+C Gram-positive bacteria)]
MSASCPGCVGFEVLWWRRCTPPREFWIEGTTERFRGYNYFGEHPELMLEFVPVPTAETPITCSPTLTIWR